MYHKASLGIFFAILLGAVLVGGSWILNVGSLIKGAVAGTTPQLVPNADGTYQQWWIFPATTTLWSDYTAVDDAPCDGAATYVYATQTHPTVNRESFYIPVSSTVPAGSLIRRITVTPCASGHIVQKGGSSTMTVFYMHGTNVSSDAGYYTVTGTTPVSLSPTVFDGLALPFDGTASTTLQIGVRLTGGTIGARVSRLSAVVDYSSPSTTVDLLPVADGTYQMWLPASASGTTHYPHVDEWTCDATTTFVYATSSGSRESYLVNLSSVPNGATITNIAIYPCESANGFATSTFGAFYRYNGVQSADGPLYAYSGSTPVPLAPTMFSSLNFIKTATSTLEIGSVVSSTTGGARLSRIAARVTFMPLSW